MKYHHFKFCDLIIFLYLHSVTIFCQKLHLADIPHFFNVSIIFQKKISIRLKSDISVSDLKYASIWKSIAQHVTLSTEDTMYALLRRTFQQWFYFIQTCCFTSIHVRKSTKIQKNVVSLPKMCLQIDWCKTVVHFSSYIIDQHLFRWKIHIIIQ